MRRFSSTLTLVGILTASAVVFADTPLKGGPAAFGSSAAKPQTQPPAAPGEKQSEKLLLIQDKQPKPVVEEVKPVVIDHTIKAASIEVAWLQESMTYPYHLRADAKPGEDFITLTGYIPHDRIRNKVVAIARQTAGKVAIHDQMIVHPQMALPETIAVDREQIALVQGMLEKALPGSTQGLLVKVDASGLTTVTGRVDEFDDRRKIIRALQGIPGCTAIRYDLRVLSPSTISTASAVVPVPPAAVAAAPAVVTPAKKPTVAQAKATTAAPVAVPMVTLTPAGSTSNSPATQQAASSRLPITSPVPAQLAKPSPTTVPVKEIVQAPVVKPTVQPAAPAPSFPVLPAISSFDKNIGGAPAIIDPSAKKPAQPEAIKPSTSPVSPSSTVEHSTLSGLFPPGMTGISDSSTSSAVVLLGSPVVVQASHTIDLTLPDPLVPNKKVVTKPITINQASYTQAKPASIPSELETAPMLIPVMPRVAR